MKEVRFGLIGLGAMGMAHAKTLLGDVPNARLCAAATASQTHAAELLALPGAEGVRVFATPAEMYQSGLIDAVLIATPHRLHVRQAVEAFRAGMHVLLEKPTGVSTQEVRLLNAEADKSGRAFVAKEASLRYMRERDLVVMANSIDKIYLQDWLAPDTDELRKYFRAPKETAVVLLRDTGVCDPKLLPLRVFFYALSNSVITNLALPEKCWRESREYFDTFQNILRIIRLTRAHNIEIPDFNIFDFPRYGEIMRRIFQYQELK